MMHCMEMCAKYMHSSRVSCNSLYIGFWSHFMVDCNSLVFILFNWHSFCML